ncbi:MAG: Flp family type IVb pilin [Bdellovibrionota bacterium]
MDSNFHVMSTRGQKLSAKKPMTRTERGASLVEYALLAALISVAALGAVTAVGERTSDNLIISSCKLQTKVPAVECCSDRGVADANSVCR